MSSLAQQRKMEGADRNLYDDFWRPRYPNLRCCGRLTTGEAKTEGIVSGNTMRRIISQNHSKSQAVLANNLTRKFGSNPRTVSLAITVLLLKLLLEVAENLKHAAFNQFTEFSHQNALETSPLILLRAPQKDFPTRSLWRPSSSSDDGPWTSRRSENRSNSVCRRYISHIRVVNTSGPA